eukprot:COSAG05_NODE_300_length_11883_cov_12.913357_5_plen_225_part_00
MDSPRSGSFFSLNKEGICSLPSYWAVHLLGAALGSWLLAGQRIPVDWDAGKRVKVPGTLGRSLSPGPRVARASKPDRVLERETVARKILEHWWGRWTTLVTLTVAVWCSVYSMDSKISRRLVNLPYVLWLLGHCLLWLCSFLLVELVAPVLPEQLRNARLSLVDAISSNMLGFFLAANVATGATNLATDTMAVPNSVALLVLTAYLACLCGGVTIVDRSTESNM